MPADHIPRKRPEPALNTVWAWGFHGVGAFESVTDGRTKQL